MAHVARPPRDEHRMTAYTAARLLCALWLLSFVSANAQPFPARPVRLIVTYPAGGPADIAAHKLIATPVGPMREDQEHLFHADGVEFHAQYTASSVEHGCSLLLEIGAIMITDPLVPLAIDPDLFALVPLKPLRMIQTSVFTPALAPQSRLVAEFKDCLRQEGRLLEKRVAALLGGSSAKTVARRVHRPRR